MPGSITEVTKAVEALLANPPPQESRQDGEAEQLIEAMGRLQVALEKPEQTVNRIIFSCRTLPIVKIAQGMGIFDAFAAASNTPLTVDQLDKQTKGDRAMLTRMLRLLIAEKVVSKSQQGYVMAPFALQFRNDTVSGEVVKHFYNTALTAIRSDDYLKARNYMTPDDAFDAPHQFANNTSKHYFEWLAENEERQRPFNATMSLPRHDDHNQWFDVYPVRERFSSSSNAFVDVGGGSGHDVARLKKEFPELTCGMVLQDLPSVVQGVSLPGIEVIPHNMFEEQPVKNARAYYMRTVLHDWPDKQALQVLARTREAMGKDSILLINENVLSEDGSDDTPVVAHTDFTMMLNFSSRDRTEQEWIDLLQKANFKIVKVWKPKATIKSRALFEAVRQDSQASL